MLKQGRNSPIAVELQVAIIYAVVNNLLREVELSDISRFEEELFVFLLATEEELLARIRTTGILTAEDEEKLRAAIISCRDKFLGKRA